MVKKLDVLVKIDKEIYEKIRKRVKQDRINFPSIKNFVEKAAYKILEGDEVIREKIISHHKENNKNNDKSKNELHNQYKHIPSGVG